MLLPKLYKIRALEQLFQNFVLVPLGCRWWPNSFEMLWNQFLALQGEPNWWSYIWNDNSRDLTEALLIYGIIIKLTQIRPYLNLSWYREFRSFEVLHTSVLTRLILGLFLLFGSDIFLFYIKWYACKIWYSMDGQWCYLQSNSYW